MAQLEYQVQKKRLKKTCAFVSTLEMTKNNPAKPFAFLMEASMLGVGVGFDDKGADKDFEIYANTQEVSTYVIPDTGSVSSHTSPTSCRSFRFAVESASLKPTVFLV